LRQITESQEEAAAMSDEVLEVGEGGKAATPKWKKMVIGLAAFLILTGVGLRVYTHFNPNETGITMGKMANQRLTEPEDGATLAATSGSSTSNPFQTGLAPNGQTGFLPSPMRPGTGNGPDGLPPPEGEIVTSERAVSTTGTIGTQPQGEVKPTAAEKFSPVLMFSGLSFFVGFCVGSALRAVAKIAVVGIGLMLLGYFGLQAAGIIGPINWDALSGVWNSIAAHTQGLVGKIQDSYLASLPSASMGGVGLATGLKK
jgi:uncharacterized membrane protein (Fun14 family)